MDVLENYQRLAETIAQKVKKATRLLPEMSESKIAASAKQFDNIDALWQALSALPVKGGWLQTPQANLLVTDGALPADKPLLLQGELYAAGTSWRIDYYQNQWRLTTLCDQSGDACLVSEQRWLSDYKGVSALHYKLYWMADDVRGYKVAHSRLVSIELDGGR
jgi:hypothetical protein